MSQSAAPLTGKPVGAVLLLMVAAACVALAYFLLRSSGTTGVFYRQDPCIARIKGTALISLMYAGDWDDRLPTAARWSDQTDRYRRARLACPMLPSGAIGYGMEDSMGGKLARDATDPESQILMFESSDYLRNAHGDGGAYSPFVRGADVQARHGGRASYAMLDGRALSH